MLISINKPTIAMCLFFTELKIKYNTDRSLWIVILTYKNRSHVFNGKIPVHVLFICLFACLFTVLRVIHLLFHNFSAIGRTAYCWKNRRDIWGCITHTLRIYLKCTSLHCICKLHHCYMTKSVLLSLKLLDLLLLSFVSWLWSGQI